MKKLILIKLGGSVITDKSRPFTAKTETIKELVSEIGKIQECYGGKMIIGHGGGSFPHVPASKYRTHKGLVGKDSLLGFCLTANAAIQINRIVVKEFLRQKLLAVSFAPLSFIYSKDVFYKQIVKALEIGITPIVYGDTVMDKKQGFGICSTEAVFDTLVNMLKKIYEIEAIIMTGDTDGVYDKNKKTIARITPKNWKMVKPLLTGSNATDVTGGMLHKVEKSINLAKKFKIKTVIVNGNKKGELTRAVLGSDVKGTVISFI